jgi:DNA polymerase V
MNPAADRRPPRLSPVGGLDGLPPGALPLLARPVPAGFPSPADDYAEGRISLDAHLVRHKEATFFLRVEGDSMRELGILDGDLLVVDRSIAAAPGSVVIAVVDGDFTVKQLGRRAGGGWLLRAANPAYPDIEIAEGKELTVWGVVRWAIHKVWPCGDEA